MFKALSLFVISVLLTTGCASTSNLLDVTSLPGSLPSLNNLNTECFRTGGVCEPPSFSSAADGAIPRP